MLVSELAGQVPSVANVTYHCELVADAARRRRVAALGADLLARAQSPAGETGGLVDDALQELIGLGAARNAASCDAVGLASAGVEAAVEGTRPGLPTGVADLDALLGGGLRGGELFVIGARPGAGKTTFALQVARHIAAHAAPAAGTRRQAP